jgi:hypothetical protein
MERTEGAVKALQQRALQRLQRLLMNEHVDQLVAALRGEKDAHRVARGRCERIE